MDPTTPASSRDWATLELVAVSQASSSSSVAGAAGLDSSNQ
ncbi:hypothetical protein ACFQX8_14425 [Klenkia terrae]